MKYFETKTLVGERMLRELKKPMKRPSEKIRVGISAAVCFGAGIASVVAQNPILAALGFLAGLLIPSMYIRRFNRIVEANLARLQEAVGAKEFEQITSFSDDQIEVYNVKMGGSLYFPYEKIVRFAETETMYALFTKENQTIAVNKISLTQAQVTQAFLDFMKDKCKNVRWK